MNTANTKSNVWVYKIAFAWNSKTIGTWTNNLEHIGLKFLPVFFKKVKQILKPGSLAMIHIMDNDELHDADPWTEKYGEQLARSYYLYFHVSAASFRYGDNRLFHILFSNGLNNDMPLTREYMYA